MFRKTTIDNNDLAKVVTGPFWLKTKKKRRILSVGGPRPRMGNRDTDENRIYTPVRCSVEYVSIDYIRKTQRFSTTTWITVVHAVGSRNVRALFVRSWKCFIYAKPNENYKFTQLAIHASRIFFKSEPGREMADISVPRKLRIFTELRRSNNINRFFFLFLVTSNLNS